MIHLHLTVNYGKIPKIIFNLIDVKDLKRRGLLKIKTFDQYQIRHCKRSKSPCLSLNSIDALSLNFIKFFADNARIEQKI